MSNLRRYYSSGNMYFITVVTFKRRPILRWNIDLFWLSINKMKSIYEFELIAWVVLPDHFHAVINPFDNNLSELIKRFKLSYSMNFRKRNNLKSGRIWQFRFWDHVIRNQDDFNRHIDYVHYNPVKHGLVRSPFEYEYSSIDKYSEYYQKDWGVSEPIEFEGDFGE